MAMSSSYKFQVGLKQIITLLPETNGQFRILRKNFITFHYIRSYISPKNNDKVILSEYQV